MPQPEFEVLFCDLCSTSVPLADLESGAALRHAGKTIGACCLATLRVGASPKPGAGVGAVAPAPVSLAPAPASGGEGRLLAVGVAVLAGLAAATIYLDNRIGTFEENSRSVLGRVEEDHRAQSDLLQSLKLDLDGVARKTEVHERFVEADGGLQQLRELVRGQFDAQGKALAALQQGVADARTTRVDYQPRFDQISQQLQQQAVALAELRAMPRLQPVEPPPDAAPKPVEPAAPGVPPDLAHQIKRLQDPDPATRFEAVDELLRAKNAAALPSLLPMAQDSDTFVRRLTVEGLRDFKQVAVVEALLTALADPEEIVRDTAWRSLKEITGQKFPFEATAAKEVRLRAQQRWQEWWEKNRATFPTS